MYQKTNPEIEKKIQSILEGDYEISVLGTNGKDNFPFLSKIIPMYKSKKLYILISDLSEHTKNIKRHQQFIKNTCFTMILSFLGCFWLC